MSIRHPHHPRLIFFACILAGLLIAAAIWNASVVTYSRGQNAAAGGSDATSTEADLYVPPAPVPGPNSTPIYTYIEVVDSCSPYYQGTCVNLRGGPGANFPSVAKLRNGVVLKVAEIVQADGETWYKIAQDAEVRYPERITSDWYVSGSVVRAFNDDGDHLLTGDVAPTSKRILVDVSDEMLYAYDGDTLFMKSPISTGLEFTPTPRGEFTIFKITPSRYMQGPIEGVSDQSYDLPGVPWNLYFTYGGAVIHGAYWHDHFGEPWSHGCVNLPLDAAQKLYEWVTIGTKVTVRD